MVYICVCETVIHFTNQGTDQAENSAALLIEAGMLMISLTASELLVLVTTTL